MDNTYFIHDAEHGRLIIVNLTGPDGDEKEIEKIAAREGLNWSDVSWGAVYALELRTPVTITG